MVSFSFPDFEISTPNGWSRPGLLSRILSGGNPELTGPNGASIKLAIGPIVTTPLPEAHLQSLEQMALGHGHDVLRGEIIEVDGRRHASLVYDVPLTPGPYVVAPDQGIRLKNYHLVFPGTEYVLTCKVSSVFHGRIEIHAYEDEYDEIVSTFHRT